jgi:hypothetical protein
MPVPNLPDLNEALRTVVPASTQADKRQIPDLPLIDESALPDLSEMEDALGLNDGRKRQGSDLPSFGFADLPALKA